MEVSVWDRKIPRLQRFFHPSYLVPQRRARPLTASTVMEPRRTQETQNPWLSSMALASVQAIRSTLFRTQAKCLLGRKITRKKKKKKEMKFPVTDMSGFLSLSLSLSLSHTQTLHSAELPS